MKRKIILYLTVITLMPVLSTCEKNDIDPEYDINTLGIPKFINNDFIELSKVIRISKFRSGTGHNYSDEFESCRSMKHYYSLDTTWAPTNNFISNIYSPVKGEIVKTEEENNDIRHQIWIKADEYPAFSIVLFHVNISNSIKLGNKVDAGEIIGTVTGTDIAVQVNTPEGLRFISYFDVVTDDVFTQYQNRGINNRNDLIISKEIRDANPIQCVNDQDPFPNQYDRRYDDWIIF
jgi:hypothetical protein